MKSFFAEPEIVKIELKMTENIAMSQGEEITDVPGFKMRQVKGTPGGCREFYIDTKHKVVNENTLMELWYKGCISAGSDAEQAVFQMMR